MILTDLSIKRPVFAVALSLIILLVGLMSFRLLSVQEYPDVESARLMVRTQYRGATPQVIESRVTEILEQGLSGVSGLDYMTSESSTGTSNIILHFTPGRDLSDAVADVRERISMVRDQLPDDVKEPLILKKEAHEQSIMFITLSGNTLSELDAYDYADRHLKGLFENIDGVAGVDVYGNNYVMRIRLDNELLKAHQIAVSDVLNALESAGSDTPAGNIVKGERHVNILTRTGLNTPEEMGNLTLGAENGHIIHLKDVADISLGKDNPENSWIPRWNGEQATVLSLSKTSNGNILSIAKAAHALIPSLQEHLPEGMSLAVSLDFSIFIAASLKAVGMTIFEAVTLVLLIILFFLHSFRASLIPLMTIPISLIGTLGFMYAFGCSINTLTLLAMVLAVGLVVDDAIVVLENIHRHMEKGKSSLEAAFEGSKEISFSIIAMTLTLVAVYAPIAFIQGLTGKLFLEFAVTLAGAVLISGLVALTLSPMMCSRFLKLASPDASNAGWGAKIEHLLGKLDLLYGQNLRSVLTFPKVILGVLGALLILGYGVFRLLPQELAPAEDNGIFLALVKAPSGTTAEAMTPYALALEETLHKFPEVTALWTATQNSSVFGAALLKDWSQRSRSQGELMGAITPLLGAFPGVRAFVFPIDSILSGGQDDFTLAVKTTGTYEELETILDRIIPLLRESGLYESVRHDLHLNTPQLNITIDRDKAALSFVSVKDISDTLETMLGGKRPITFEKNGKHYDVVVQSSPERRQSLDHIRQLYVKSEEDPTQKEWLSLDTFVTIDETATPENLNHFSKMRSAMITGDLKKGVSMGKALKETEAILRSHLPSHMHMDFGGHVREFFQSSSDMYLIFFTSLLFIYLVLAIQFNSFLDPLLIMVTVPLSMVGAFCALYLAGCSLNIFSQVGIITLVGLITKHGILIVDFANKRLATGLSPLEAIIEAATLRLRPILMTTGAMVLGAIPLALAGGAGAQSRHQIGWVLVGGLLLGTLLTLFILPFIYTRAKK